MITATDVCLLPNCYVSSQANSMETVICGIVTSSSMGAGDMHGSSRNVNAKRGQGNDCTAADRQPAASIHHATIGSEAR